MKKGTNEGLKSKQEKYRQETISKVEKAIKELKEEGFEVSTKLLIERTGLSATVLGKKHVLKVLEKHAVCRFKNIKQVPKDSEKNYIVDLERQVKELERELKKTKEILNSAIKRNIKLEVEIKDLKDTNELLRGQLKLNYEKALARGIDLE